MTTALQLDSARSAMWILLKANQENLCVVSVENSASRGLLPGVQTTVNIGGPIPQRLRWDRGGALLVVIGEGGGVAVFGDHNVRGGVKAPTDRIHGPAEFPPAGAGFFAVRHPRRREGISASRGRAAQSISPGPL